MTSGTGSSFVIVLGGVTFALVLALMLALYWLFVVRPESQAHAQLTERLKPKAPAKKRRLLMTAADEGGQASRANRLVRAVGAPVQRQLDRAGLKISLLAFLLLSAWIGCLVAILVGIAAHRVGLALVGGAAAAWTPYVYVQWRGGRRAWKFEEQFPEAVDLIARALRAGHALPTAIGMVAAEIPNPVGAEFKKLYDQQNFGMSLPDSLRAFADRVPILDARFFVTAVLTQRESGGNLAGVLDNLASVIRERFKVKRQVRVISAHGRMTATILSAMPPVLAMMIMAIHPAGMMLLIEDPIGNQMILGAVVLQIIGMFVMKRIVNVEF